jgi:Na+/H+-dicarboxylate symporter
VYNKFNFSKAFACMKNVLPATITGFSTISSAASLPVLILCSENNVDPEIVDTVLPASINIHTLGSAIGVTVLAVTIAEMFNIHITFLDFVIFSFYYALAKFSVAAVPGGVIVVVTPLLEQYLGFTPGMTGLITAMYMLFDPFGTAANVTGNGSFVIMFDKLLKKFNLK